VRIAVGWLLWVSLRVIDVLFDLALRWVAVGWQVSVSLVCVGLFKLELVVVVLG
jgi:hypothetical protein